MIAVKQEEPGSITIDFAGEPGFDAAVDGVDLTGGLFVREFGPKAIVVEETGQPGIVVMYIRDRLEGVGYKVEIAAGLQRRVDQFLEEQQLIGAIREGRHQIPVRAGAVRRSGVRRKLLKHQLAGLAHALAVRHSADFSVPGSGKTAVALAAYATFVKSKTVKRLMVIGPASCFVPWEEEFAATFGRPVRVVRLIGTKVRRAAILQDLENEDLVLCTYQMAQKEKRNLASTLSQDPYLLVLDESHHVKNIELGPWAAAALELAPLASRRMILTGTPAPHSLLDVWSQFTFLWPSQGLLGDRVGFEQRVLAPGEPMEEVKSDLKHFFHRTKKSDLGLRKPVTLYAPIGPDQVPKRQLLIVRLLELRTINEARDIGLGTSDMAILRQWRRARTIRLLQAASNPALLSTAAADFGDPGEPLDADPTLAALLKDYHKVETPAKLSWVLGTVRRLVAEDRKVVVWASFVGNLVHLKAQLADLHPLLAYGGVPAYDEDNDPDFESRERNIREFKSRKDRPVLLANPGACAESISLHLVCHDAVYLERTFNCGQFLQSMDRIHRVGMPSKARTTYHIPLMPCAIERVLDRRLRERQEVLYGLLDDDMPIVGYDDDELGFLEQEEDLDAIFGDLIKEIEEGVKQGTRGASGRGRSRR